MSLLFVRKSVSKLEEQVFEGGGRSLGFFDQFLDPEHLAVVIAQVLLEEVVNSVDLCPGDHPVHLGDFDQDVDQQKDEDVVGLGL